MLTCPCNEDTLRPYFYMSLDVRKPVFGVSDQVDTNQAVQQLEMDRDKISSLGSRGIVLSV